MNLDESVKHLTERWGGKSLAEFQAEAEKEANGTVYEALRVDQGPRLMLMMCLTERDQIGILERVFDFGDEGVEEDWNELTLIEVFERTARGQGFAFEALHDEYRRRKAVIICSVEPASMKRLNMLFNLSA